jgi:hypothetical protein
MTSVDLTRAHVALLALYLGKAEARDKICRAIQYGSKFISAGEKGVAQDVEKHISLSRKVFRLLKFVNDLQALLSPAPKTQPLALALLTKVKHACIGTFLALDQVVWLGRSGIYKNKENTDLVSRLSLYCWMAGSLTGSVVEASELVRVSLAVTSVEKALRKAKAEKGSKEQLALLEKRTAQSSKFQTHVLNYAKNSLDVFVAIGLLQLAPKTVTPRVTGALGFVTSLIALYQLLPPPTALEQKAKAA